jgi:hypothetical protein
MVQTPPSMVQTPRGVGVELASVHPLTYSRSISGCLGQRNLIVSEELLRIYTIEKVDAIKATRPLL